MPHLPEYFNSSTEPNYSFSEYLSFAKSSGYKVSEEKLSELLHWYKTDLKYIILDKQASEQQKSKAARAFNASQKINHSKAKSIFKENKKIRSINHHYTVNSPINSIINNNVKSVSLSKSDYATSSHDTSTKELLQQEQLKHTCTKENNVPLEPEPTTIESNDIDNNIPDFSSIQIKLPSDQDRYIINDVDISQTFYNFQLHVQNLTSSKKLFFESHVHHILAMSSILLLKPKCIDDDLKMFLNEPTKKSVINKIKDSLDMGNNNFNINIMNEMIKIINEVRKKNIDRMDGVIQLYQLKSLATVKESKIILSIANLLNKLPEDTFMEEIKEIELITRYLDPALQPLFDDLDDHIIFRWTSTTNPETKKSSISISQRRPDSLINNLNGVHMGKSLGFGEVKAKYQSTNNFAIAKDLIRLGIFSKNSIDTGKLNGVLTFQAVGLQVTFYLTKLLADGLYIMIEIGYLKLPGSLHDLLSYVVHLSDVLDLVNIFYNECASASTFVDSRKRNSMTTPEIDRVVDSRKDRKRACITSYYT